MTRVEAWAVRLCRIGVGLSFATLMAAVLIQVVGRSVGSSPIWTEELTRYAMLYTVAFGAGLSFRSGDLVNVDVLTAALPLRGQRGLRIAGAALTAAMCLALLWPAWRYVSIGRIQTSPALLVRMDLIHLSVLVLLALLALFAALRLWAMLARGDDGAPTNAREPD